MVGVAVDNIVAKTSDTIPTPNPWTEEALDETQLRIDIAISLCLLVGIIQVKMIYHQAQRARTFSLQISKSM